MTASSYALVKRLLLLLRNAKTGKPRLLRSWSSPPRGTHVQPPTILITSSLLLLLSHTQQTLRSFIKLTNNTHLFHLPSHLIIHSNPPLLISSVSPQYQSCVMAKLVAFIVLLALSALAAARPDRLPQFTVQGNVVCDTCRVGFETPASTPIDGAVVRLECKNRASLKPAYTKEGVTDKTGCYKIRVAGDHADQLCEVVLVSSPEPECATIEEGRERARVFPTYDNGIASTVRYANNMCFLKDYPLATCPQVLSMYAQESDD